MLVLSALFVSELMRQRIEQTAAANDVLAHEVWLETRKAVETGLRANPPVDRSDEALHVAVVDALRSQPALSDVMNTIVRYSPEVQDVSVTDAHGMTLVSTDPGCGEPAGVVPVQPGKREGRRRDAADGGGVRQAASAGYLSVAGPERGAVSGCACGGAVDVFEELV